MILRDFRCEGCNKQFEDYVSSSDRFSACPDCGQPCEMVLSAPRLGVYNDPQIKAEALKKRSHDHTISELKKEPEKHGFLGADKPKGWNINRSQKKDSN